MVATVTSDPVASDGPWILPGNAHALPLSTVFPILQRSNFKPSSLSSNVHSFPHQTLHSLWIIWPPNSQKRTKIRLEHSKPPPSPPCQIHRYICIPAQPSLLLQWRKGLPLACQILIPPVISATWTVQLSVSPMSSTPPPLVPPSHQLLTRSLSPHNTLSFDSSS